MSFAGMREFNKNLNKVMLSDGFSKMSEDEKMILGYRLLNSKFGIGILGKVSKLKIRSK